jgi:hypothetical protein
MAMIFVHDYSVKGKKKDKTFVVWALPCPKDLSEEQIKKRLIVALRKCYKGTYYGDHEGNPLPALTVARAVVEYAFANKHQFWECQIRPKHVVTAPFEHGVVTHGLLDVENEVLKKNRWTT